MKSPVQIDDFQKSSDYQQEHILFNRGTLIESELCGNLIFVIYSVDLFFVEVGIRHRKR